MKQKVLVTGANGYIGRNVIDYLLDNNIDVVAVDISLNKIISEKVKKIEIRSNKPQYADRYEIYRQ